MCQTGLFDPLCSRKDNTGKEIENIIPCYEYFRSTKKHAEVKTGDIITFGRYSVDDWECSAIEWIVLAKEEARMLLLSRYGLDTQPYNNNLKSVALPPYYNDYKSVNWEICTLRQWLNGLFFDYSFNDDEKKLIWLSKLDNPDNPKYGTPGGNPTSDRVFLLSLDEAEKYLVSEDVRYCMPTEWALHFGASVSEFNGNAHWWLRSPGHDTRHAALVTCNGLIAESGTYVSSDQIVVRPALWLFDL